MLKKALASSFFLYLTALQTSMAGMEIFGWLTFLLAFVVCFVERSRAPGQKAFFPLGADGAFLGLIVITILGYLINAKDDANLMTMVGSLRWGLMMYGIAYAARWTKATEKAFAPLMIVATVVALHSFYEAATGWDLIRHRPVADYVEGGQARGTGFFSMPTTYAHSVVMTACFTFAAIFLRWGQTRWQRIVVAVAGFMIIGSLVATFTRGAWISFFFAAAVMTLCLNRRLFLGFLVAALVASAGLVTFSPVFRSRVATILDFNYGSNTGRLDLWRANWWMIKDYPILGIGLNENERRTEEYNIAHGVPDANVGNAHNTYLQFLSGTGVLGFTAFMAFIGFYFWLTVRLWKTIPKENTWHRVVVLGALGAQVAMHIGGLTDCNFKDAEVNHQFVSILAILSYLRFVYLKQGEKAQASGVREASEPRAVSSAV